MSRTRVAAVFITLFSTSAGAAFAGTPASGGTVTAEAVPLSEGLSALHAVSQWAVKLSEMADKRAKSELVKSYAREVVSANSSADAKIMSVAQKQGIDVSAVDAKTEEGKSLLDRMKAESVLLGSLEGDAFDKEYMTLVTNTQQSVLNLLKASKASAKDSDVKQLIGDMTTTIEKRLKTAQDVMSKIYGNRI